jgi:lipopolysaccharide export system permease protein
LKILFITSNRLGDAVLTTGLLQHVLTGHPEARLTVVVGPVAAPLFRSVPGLERLIALAKRPWGGHWLELWRDLVAIRWDLVVDVRDTPVSRLLRSRRCVVVRTPNTSVHKVVAMARALGLDTPLAPRLWLDQEALALAAAAIPGESPLLVLAPAANWAGKEWPADRFAELADRLTGPGGLLAGARTLVLGAPGEEERCRPVLRRLGTRGIDLVGRTDAQQAAACIAQGQLFVGNDSGLMHVAAAAGVPTLGLFGPTPADVYAPWGPQARAVVTGPGGLAGLTTERVVAEAEALLGASVAVTDRRREGTGSP